MAGRSSLAIIDHRDQQDMRKVSWGAKFLKGAMAEHQLTHGQAVAYRNRAETRWRLVMCLHGMPVLIIPPVEREPRLSIDLGVSQFVRTLNAKGGTLTFIDDQVKRSAVRLEQRKQLAQKAQRGRKKHGKKTKQPVTKKQGRAA